VNKALLAIPAFFCMALANAADKQLPTIEVRADNGEIGERRLAVNQKTIIEKSEIAALGGLTVSEVLTKLPGIDAGSQGSDGAQAMRARGMARDAVQILVDGERLAGNSRMAMAMVGRLPSEEIERIEIMRGASAEFGGAAAVTVNLVMRKAVRKTSTSLKAAAGVREDRPFGQFNVTRSDTEGNLSWVLPLSINHHEMVGERRLERQEYSAGTRDSWTIDRDSNRFAMDELVFSPRLTWRDGNDYLTIWPTLFHSEVSRTNDMNRQRYADPLAGSGLAADAARRDRENGSADLLRLRVDGEKQLAAGKFTGRLALMDGSRRSDTEHSGQSGGLSWSGSDRLRRDESEMNGLLRLDTPLGDHVLAVAVEAVSLSRADSQSLLGTAATPYNASERQWVLWAQDEYAFGDRLTLTGGLRGESFRLESDGKARRDGIVAPSLALRWEPAPQWVVRSSLGSALKMPKLDELSNLPVVNLSANSPLEPERRGNPNLRPERSINFEAVIERYLAGDLGVLGANFYARHTEDFVERRVQLEGARWVDRPYNEGTALHWGVELDGKWRIEEAPLKGGTLRTHLTVPRSRVDDTRLGIQRAAREQPRYQLTLGYDQSLSDGASAGINLRYYAEVRTEVAGELQSRTADRSLLDLYYLHRLNRSFNLRFNAANLLADNTRQSSQAYAGSQQWWLNSEDRAIRSFTLALEGKW